MLQNESIIKYIIILILFNKFIFADEYTIAIVKINNTNIQKENKMGLEYKIDNYKQGKILELDSCDKYDWCKVKNKELYIPKYALAIMKLPNLPFIKNKNKSHTKIFKSPIIKKPDCIKLNQIDLNENELLTKEKQKELLGKYKNDTCINVKIIKLILQDIARYYSTSGYVTTRPFLLTQNIKDGQIDINVSVGKIENIIDTEHNTTTSNILFAFAGQIGNALNLRDIETSLESINRIPSLTSTLKIKPSKQRGNSIIKVQTKSTQLPFDFTLGLSGKKDFKDKNPSLISTLSFYNPLSINDILKFSLNGSYIQKEYQSTKGNEINYSFSIGSYLLEFIKSYSKYRQGVDGINNIYLSNGDTNGYRAKLSKIIFRNQNNKLKTSFSLYHKSSKNYFQNNEIETSSYKTTHIQIDLLHTWIKSWGQIASTFSIYQGKDWLGARSDDYVSDESDYSSYEKLEFTKYSLGTNLIYNFVPTYSLSSNLHIQYANDNLYSADKLSVGSDYSVRGYSGNYFGNTGWYLNNNITKNIDLDLYEPLLQNISVYFGLDYGKVPCKNDNIGSCGEMYGSGIGLRSNGKYFSTNFSLLRPLKKLDDDFKIKNNFKYTFTMKF